MVFKYAEVPEPAILATTFKVSKAKNTKKNMETTP